MEIVSFRTVCFFHKRKPFAHLQTFTFSFPEPHPSDKHVEACAIKLIYARTFSKKNVG